MCLSKLQNVFVQIEETGRTWCEFQWYNLVSSWFSLCLTWGLPSDNNNDSDNDNHNDYNNDNDSNNENGNDNIHDVNSKDPI